MTAGSGIVVIAATGASQSLQFYWQVLGAATWNPEQVAGTGTTYSAQTLTTNSADAIVSAAGPGGSLDFYWQLFGAATWNPEQVAPPGSVG
jgi:hypothetical protein